MGKDELIKRKSLGTIQKMIDDPLSKIRMNCYETMLNISDFQEGIDHLLSTDILDQLVDKIIEEKDVTILEKVLSLIKSLLYGEGGTYKALTTEIITRLAGLLDHSLPTVFIIENFFFYTLNNRSVNCQFSAFHV